MITKEDAVAFVKQLEELKADAKKIDAIKEVKGPPDLTRRINELEKENSMLQQKLKRLQTIMMEQFRNKGAL